jgi:HK97 family phage portal protein
MSPLAACGLTAAQGLAIQKNSAKFFGNMARPSGMLSAPGTIKDETAKRLQDKFHETYGGENIGKILVGGDGIEFKTFTMAAADAQLIEQLRWTAEDVCRAFGVPGYKVGVGQMPTYQNIGPLNQAYYSDTLQELIECVEALLDEGLELPRQYQIESDVEMGLLRMDKLARYEAYDKAGKWMAPNEMRGKEQMEPVPGGDEPLAQEQYWPLSVLQQRAPPDTAPPEADAVSEAFDEEFDNVSDAA